MDKRVFHYRNGQGYFVAGIFAVFALGMGGLPLYSIITGNPVNINERSVTFQESPLVFVPFFLFGLVSACLGAVFLVWMLSTRFEVEDGRVRHFTRFGKLRFDEPLANVRVKRESNGAVEVAGQVDGMKKLVLTVNGREERVWNSITNYSEFKRLLMQPVVPRIRPDEPLVPRIGYVPAEQLFHYRYTYTHWLGFFLTAFMGYIIFSVFSGRFSNTESPWVMLAWTSPFWLLAGWLQLSGWFEQIKLGPNGIEWRDWKGKVRCTASLDEITDRAEHDGEASYFDIETKNGKVQANCYIKGYDALKDEIAKVVMTRR